MHLRIYYVLILSYLLVSSCGEGPTQAEFDDIMNQLETCQAENEELKNTPEARLLTAQEYESKGNLDSAEVTYKILAEKFPETEEGQKAIAFLKNIEQEKEAARIAEERKKQLGFKSLKEQKSIEQGDVTLTFSDIKIQSRWIFDRYGDRYHYIEAERGNKLLTSRLTIKSESNNPVLPPIHVYKLEGGELVYLNTLSYKFYRWEDYGSYLGNNADYGNDFSRSASIRFSPGCQISEDDIKDHAIFLMVEKKNCVARKESRLDNPPVSYTTQLCKLSSPLNVDKASEDFFTIEIFNKGKI